MKNSIIPSQDARLGHATYHACHLAMHVERETRKERKTNKDDINESIITLFKRKALNFGRHVNPKRLTVHSRYILATNESRIKPTT